jgi:hypothetical protein
MKKSYIRGLAYILVVVLALPIFSFSNINVAIAKAKKHKEPKFSISSKTLYDNGETFELSLDHISGDISGITWYSQNDKVATVNVTNDSKKAIVTSGRKGNTYIKCKIMFRNGSVYQVSCKVNVKSSATDVDITNAQKDNNGRHVIVVGEKYNFDCKVTPSNAKVETYWYLDNEFYATVKDDGTVTAKKPGVVNLTVVAAYTKLGAYISQIKDTVTLEIVEKNGDHDWDDDWDDDDFKPEAILVSLVRSDTNKITATFDRAIQTPGILLVNNKTECIEGYVDSNDSKKVHYTISSTAAQLTGWQKVYIGYWEGYDVKPSDKSSDALREQSINFTISTVTTLPGPISISQSTNDNDIITIQFKNQLDEGSAENLSNYSIAGATIVSAELTNSSNGGSVKLIVKEGTIATNSNYLFTITGIKGINNTFSAMNTFQTTMALKENIVPTLTTYYYSYPTTIVYTFSEPISGTPNFKVIQNNVDIASYSTISGNNIMIILKNTPTMNVEMQIIPTETNVISDSSGNKTTSILTRKLIPTLN